MKNLLFCLLFLPSVYFSQNIRFTYDYRFVSDTLNKDNVSNEMVVLDYYGGERRSVYTGLKHILSDSTMVANSKKGIMSFPDASMKIKYVVEKLPDEKLMYFYTPNHMPDPVLKVLDTRGMNWDILNEQKQILGYPAQKATTAFAGRQWTAWFTSEIPISDGPYKFSGLPGLILEIADKTNTHLFEIVSIQKQYSNYFVLDDATYREAKQIALKEYEKIPTDPFELFKRKAIAGGVHFRDNEERQKFFREMDIRIKENRIHDNNPIEILKNDRSE